MCVCVYSVSTCARVSVWRDIPDATEDQLAVRREGSASSASADGPRPPFPAPCLAPGDRLGGTGPGSGRDGGLERSLVSTVRLMNGQEEKV